jgi:hypothetical protein
VSESGSHNNEHKNEKEKKWEKMDAKYEPLSLHYYILIRSVKLPRKRALMHS